MSQTLSSVSRQLDEVVTAAQRAELQLDAPRKALHLGLEFPEGLQHAARRRPRLRRLLPDRLRMLCVTDRDTLLDRQAQLFEAIRQPLRGQARLHCRHAATHIDSHGSGCNSAAHGNHGADRGASADMHVGHHGHVMSDPGQARHRLELLDSVGLDLVWFGPEFYRNLVPVDARRHA
jgi:hypothetical protein